MYRYKAILFIMMLLVGISTTAAQSGTGQICVRSFNDRNSNGIRESGEPFITAGISGDLLDAGGVVIQNQVIEDSLWSSQGMICFQNLEAGTYQINLNSTTFEATTSNVFTASVEVNTVEELSFGARAIVPETVTEIEGGEEGGITDLADLQNRVQWERLFFSALAATIITGAMIVMGATIYVIFFRRRLEQLYPAYPGVPTSISPSMFYSNPEPAEKSASHSANSFDLASKSESVEVPAVSSPVEAPSERARPVAVFDDEEISRIEIVDESVFQPQPEAAQEVEEVIDEVAEDILQDEEITDPEEIAAVDNETPPPTKSNSVFTIDIDETDEDEASSPFLSSILFNDDDSEDWSNWDDESDEENRDN